MTLNIILKELDTTSDFLKYLNDKENLISETSHIAVSGEEDLLAIYLSNIDNHFHCFYTPNQCRPDNISVSEDIWNNFTKEDAYKNIKDEKIIGYSWDMFLKSQIDFLFNGTMEYVSSTSYEDQSKMYEFLAGTSRLERSMYSKIIIDLMNQSDENNGMRWQCIIKKQESICFLFISFPYSHDNNREKRMFRLESLLKMFLHNFECRHYIDRLNLSSEDFDDIRKTAQLLKDSGIWYEVQ